MPTPLQVSQLLGHVDDARKARQQQYVRLLSEVTPRLEAARAAALQRNRLLAPRFNVFKYLREDELGLSRMIVDLLDPTAEHGQGTAFLEAMLDTFPETRGLFGELRETTADPIKMMTERWTTDGRRIDITVDIPVHDGWFCLAFENKPYADDQPGQLESYLAYLREQYGERFLLVYLPPDNREPDESSLSRAAREHWRGHFSVMPYIGDDNSLENWFATCRERCDAERVGLYLTDAKTFCRHRFGESNMTDNPDTRFVQEHLSNNPEHLRSALAVHDAWRLVRAEVCERFLEHLRQTVEDRLHEELPDIASDLQVRCHYGEAKRNSKYLWIYRRGWVRYDDLAPNRNGRSGIGVQAYGTGPDAWYWGVRSPKGASTMTEEERERRGALGKALGEHGLSLAQAEDDWWPQWEWLRRYQDWNPIVPELHEECEVGGGPVTSYYVDGLLNIARLAIPAIDEVEMQADHPERPATSAAR